MGFEPTVAINYDSFQDCSVRPLRHASVRTTLPQKLDVVDRAFLSKMKNWSGRRLDALVLATEQNAFEAGEHAGNAIFVDG